MNLTIGNNVSSILYNGNPVSELIFNGHSIWKNAPDYWNIPMTFEILTDGVITTINPTSSSSNWSATSTYKLNGGSEHTFITGRGQTLTSITVHTGDKIEWTFFQTWKYNSGTSGSSLYSRISATCQFKVYGNLYLSNSSIESMGFFAGVFNQCTTLLDVENLIIPYDDIQAADSFRNMFSGCTSITKSPKIYIYNIKAGSVIMGSMFSGCSNLTEVFCMICNSNSSTVNLTSWLYNVASSGKLICMPGTTWYSGANGLPSNWTLEPYTPNVECLANGTISGHETSETNYNDFTGIQYQNNIKRDTTATTNPVRLTLASLQNQFSEAFIEINKTNINSIPSNAKIRGVHGRIKYYVNNATYVSGLDICFCSGSTVKGISRTDRSTTTTNIYSIIGDDDWTLDELKNIRIRIQAKHNASTSTAYVYIYGIEVYAIYEV